VIDLDVREHWGTSIAFGRFGFWLEIMLKNITNAVENAAIRSNPPGFLYIQFNLYYFNYFQNMPKYKYSFFHPDINLRHNISNFLHCPA